MPSPKKCGTKFPVGSKAYNDCVNYKGMDDNQTQGMGMGRKKIKGKGSKPREGGIAW